MNVRRPLEIGVVALALALLAAIAAFSNRPEGEQPSVPSMSDTGRRGVAAWALLLRREGFDVRPFAGRLTQLNARGATLVLAGDPTDLVSQPTGGEMDALAHWVRGGGHVVFAGFQLGRSAQTKFGVSRLDAGTKTTPRATVTLHRPFPFAVRRLQGTFNASYAPAKDHRVLARSSLGILAEEHPLGKGDVVAIADPELFNNSTLAKADNARLGVALFHSNRVLFDEGVYGLTGDRRFWDVLGAPMQAAVILACIVGLLAIAGNILPFAPPLRTAEAARRTSAGYIESLAQLLSAGRARAYAIATFAESARRRMHGRNVTDGIRARMNELSDLANRSRSSDADVLRAGELYSAIRKDVK